VQADAQVAARLDLAEGTDVVHLRRQRLAHGEPLAVLVNWLPVDLVPWSTEELQSRGLYALLRTIGVRICVASQRIGAQAATSADARLLGERRGAPLLSMERVGYDNSGRAVEFGQHLYRASRYSFELTLVDS
jgi:DNA-binding GntR family transcriptional regulator